MCDSFVIVQSLSCVWLSVTSMDCSRSTPGPSVLHYLAEFAQTHVHWAGDAIYFILCHPLLLLHSILPRNQGLSQWISSSHQLWHCGTELWAPRWWVVLVAKNMPASARDVTDAGLIPNLSFCLTPALPMWVLQFPLPMWRLQFK